MPPHAARKTDFSSEKCLLAACKTLASKKAVPEDVYHASRGARERQRTIDSRSARGPGFWAAPNRCRGAQCLNRLPSHRAAFRKRRGPARLAREPRRASKPPAVLCGNGSTNWTPTRPSARRSTPRPRPFYDSKSPSTREARWTRTRTCTATTIMTSGASGARPRATPSSPRRRGASRRRAWARRLV